MTFRYLSGSQSERLQSAPQLLRIHGIHLGVILVCRPDFRIVRTADDHGFLADAGVLQQCGGRTTRPWLSGSAYIAVLCRNRIS